MFWILSYEVSFNTHGSIISLIPYLNMFLFAAILQRTIIGLGPKGCYKNGWFSILIFWYHAYAASLCSKQGAERKLVWRKWVIYRNFPDSLGGIPSGGSGRTCECLQKWYLPLAVEKFQIWKTGKAWKYLFSRVFGLVLNPI